MQLRPETVAFPCATPGRSPTTRAKAAERSSTAPWFSGAGGLKQKRYSLGRCAHVGALAARAERGSRPVARITTSAQHPPGVEPAGGSVRRLCLRARAAHRSPTRSRACHGAPAATSTRGSCRVSCGTTCRSPQAGTPGSSARGAQKLRGLGETTAQSLGTWTFIGRPAVRPNQDLAASFRLPGR